MKPDPKKKTAKDHRYLAWIRKQPCVITGKTPCHAHHTDTGGVGMKGSDYSAVPLYHTEHRRCHDVGNKTFWASYDLPGIIKDLRDRYEKKNKHIWCNEFECRKAVAVCENCRYRKKCIDYLEVKT